MKQILWIITGLLPFMGGAQDSISVLFIGNSYTYVNDLPGQFTQLAASLGKITTVQSQTQGGATFAVHAGNSASYTNIHAKPWDYVVLQGQSQEPAFPDTQVDQQSISPAMQLADSVYAARFCSELMLFMTWGRENGDPQWAPISTYEGMQQRLRDGYLRIADSCQASVSPVGMAWKYVRENHPEINLYNGDGSHPSNEGTYLAACTFYAALFRSSPVGAGYTAGLTTTVTDALQQAAAIAVLDSLDTWHLRTPEEHTVAAFDYQLTDATLFLDNTSRKAQAYEWAFGDGQISAEESPVHVFGQNGSYTVQLIAISECGNDTTTVGIEINALHTSGVTGSESVVKTLEPGWYEVVLPAPVSDTVWKVYDSTGREVKARIGAWHNGAVQVDVRYLPSGSYFFSNGELRLRLTK